MKSCYGLLFFFAIGCAPSTPSKTVNEHLIAYIDSAASSIIDPEFDVQRFEALTDSFNRYFPISIYTPGQNTIDSVVLVTMHKSNDPLQDDVLTVTLPSTIGTHLSFKIITDHFGPLDPEPPGFREYKNPPPIILNLMKHFKPPVEGLSLHISAAHFPEEAKNQIVSVQILKSKHF